MKGSRIEEQYCRKAYIAQIFHHIVEFTIFFVLIADLFDGFLADKVFRNLGPHPILLWFFGFEPSSVVSIIDNGEFSRFLRLMTLTASDTIQLASTTSFTLENDILIIVPAIAGTTVGFYVSSLISERNGSPTFDVSLSVHRAQVKGCEVLGEFSLEEVVLELVLVRSLESCKHVMVMEATMLTMVDMAMMGNDFLDYGWCSDGFRRPRRLWDWFRRR